jgi:hypothetical protein
MELGLLLSNTPVQRYEADWASDGLCMIAEVIAEFRGNRYDQYGWSNLLTSNAGQSEYINTVFEMRSYCWCDSGWDEDDTGPHAKGCPPNFVYKKNGLIINWYKHASRGVTSNMEYPGAKNWFKAVAACIESVKEHTNPSLDCEHRFVNNKNKALGICGLCGISFGEWHG